MEEERGVEEECVEEEEGLTYVGEGEEELTRVMEVEEEIGGEEELTDVLRFSAYAISHFFLGIDFKI